MVGIGILSVKLIMAGGYFVKEFNACGVQGFNACGVQGFGFKDSETCGVKKGSIPSIASNSTIPTQGLTE